MNILMAHMNESSESVTDHDCELSKHDCWLTLISSNHGIIRGLHDKTTIVSENFQCHKVFPNSHVPATLCLFFPAYTGAFPIFYACYYSVGQSHLIFMGVHIDIFTSDSTDCMPLLGQVLSHMKNNIRKQEEKVLEDEKSDW